MGFYFGGSFSYIKKILVSIERVEFQVSRRGLLLDTYKSF